MKTGQLDAIRYAARLEGMAESAGVTELLKLAERPEVISFAGGLPDPRSFPIERFQECAEAALRVYGSSALNYGATEGFSPLREWLAQRMRAESGCSCEVDDILVTSGGLEALNLISMALLEPGTPVVVGAPTYLVALHVFRAYQAQISSVPLDSEGIDPEQVDARLGELAAAGNPARFVYVIPSFQNPSGTTLTRERREALVEVCARQGVPLVEDHAYADLRFEGQHLPSLKEMDPENVIFVHTFSKIFSPGTRLGWIWANSRLVRATATCKLGTDQCANTLTQRILLDYASRGWLDEQIQSSISLYRAKKELMSNLLRAKMPASVSWLEPEGGFFFWPCLPQQIRSEELMKTALKEHNLAVVAGTLFYADNQGQDHIRLAFSFLKESRFEAGLECLAELIRSRT